MTGAEAFVVVGIIANIVQIVEFTGKAVERVKDSAQDLHSLPKAFRDIQSTLPLLANTLSKTQSQVQSGSVDEGTCKTLRPVLEACEEKIKELESIFAKALPTNNTSGLKRGWKALLTIGQDKRVEELGRQLSQLRSNLVHYHVTNMAIRGSQRKTLADLTGPNTTSEKAMELEQARQNDREQRCLHSLAFPTMRSRRLGIEDPAKETCKWIFEDALYRQWCSRIDASTTHSLLWIKGKPGSGKSTLMKHLLQQAEEELCPGDICISHFFCARGSGLERNIEGLYRSLTHQLVWRRPELLTKLTLSSNEKDSIYGYGNWTWHLKELKEFFHVSIAEAGFGSVKVFVDALDECKDDDVQEVVTALERSAAASVSNGTILDICWSSRHYPHIRVKRSLKICMELKNAGDITRYVCDKVQGSCLIDAGLEKDIIRKADGVFLWVVLVFRQLLDAEDQGYSRAEKKRIVEDLPSELEDLFQLIIGSVRPRHRRARALMFLYVIVSREHVPLAVEQMQYALAFSADPLPQSIDSWLSSDSYLEPQYAFTNYVREVSGGLLEITNQRLLRSSGHTGNIVRFIHESVREFVHYRTSYDVLRIANSDEVLLEGHVLLRDACLNYLSCRGVLDDLMKDLIAKEAFRDPDYVLSQLLDQLPETRASKYMFVLYATYWPHFAREAEERGKSQADLIQLIFKKFSNTALKLALVLPRCHYQDRMSAKEMLFLKYCAEGLSSCISSLVQAGVNPLFEYKGHSNVNSLRGYEGPRIALIKAIEFRRPKVVRELLDTLPAKLSSYSISKESTVHTYLWTRSQEIITILLDHGLSADSPNEEGQVPMQSIIEKSAPFVTGKEKAAMIKTLAEYGANVQIRNKTGRSLLHLALQANDQVRTTQALINIGADVNAVDDHGKTCLHLAVEHYRPEDYYPSRPNMPSGEFLALLREALSKSKLTASAMQAALNAGANSNAQDENGDTPLHIALRWSPFKIGVPQECGRLKNSITEASSCAIQLLLSYGADTTIKNKDGMTPFDLISDLLDANSAEIRAMFISYGHLEPP